MTTSGIQDGVGSLFHDAMQQVTGECKERANQLFYKLRVVANLQGLITLRSLAFSTYSSRILFFCAYICLV